MRVLLWTVLSAGPCFATAQSGSMSYSLLNTDCSTSSPVPSATTSPFPSGPGCACSFTITSSGGVSGVAGQLSDGQIRVNGSYAPAPFCINNGQITDSAGRGCIITGPPTTQLQCDSGAAPARGFVIDSNGAITLNGSPTFYACPATDTEYNLYTNPNFGQTKCVQVSLTASGCGSPGNSCTPVTQTVTISASAAGGGGQALGITQTVTITSCAAQSCPAGSATTVTQWQTTGSASTVTITETVVSTASLTWSNSWATNNPQGTAPAGSGGGPSFTTFISPSLAARQERAAHWLG